MPTLAEALTPFLQVELPAGGTVSDVPQGIAVHFDAPQEGRRWFQRSGDGRRYRFEFDPEVFDRLLDSIAQTPEDSHLQDVDYLEHAAAVVGYAVEQHYGQPGANDVSLFVGAASTGTLEVMSKPDAGAADGG